MTNIIPISDMQQMAASMAKSKLFGFTTPDEAVSLMLIAQAEGMHPAIAARDYHIIKGRPSLKADAMMARFQSAGGKVDWKELTDKRVCAVFSHPKGGSAEIDWDMGRAKTAGLLSNPSWSKYPRQMLRARVISEGIRTVYPGVVIGIYTPEEVEDFDDVKEAKPKTKAKDMGSADVVHDEQPQEMLISYEPDTSRIEPEPEVQEILDWLSKQRSFLREQDTFDALENWLKEMAFDTSFKKLSEKQRSWLIEIYNKQNEKLYKKVRDQNQAEEKETK